MPWCSHDAVPLAEDETALNFVERHNVVQMVQQELALLVMDM
jgi:hypothetical protein